MATCMYCGSQIPDGLKFCTSCGAALPVEAPIEATVVDASSQPYQQPSFNQSGPEPPQGYTGQQPQFAAPGQQVVNDSGSIGWGVLGFFIPLVGLILFLVWRGTKPKCAQMAGIGALIGFCLSLFMNFFLWQ